MASKKNQFLIAARLGKTAMLTQLLKESTEDLLTHQDPEQKSTALHLAAYFGHAECVSVLCEHKAPLELQAIGGATPLLAAITRGHTDVVRLLLHAGANARARMQSNGLTAVHLAVALPDTRGCEIIRLLHKFGADINATCQDGRSPLHYAIDKENVATCATLLQLDGCDVEQAQRGTEATPLFVAVHNGLLEIAELLLRSGANVSAVQHDRATSLHIAAQRNLPHCLELLLHWGADADHVDRQGVAPIHVCAASGSVTCLDILIRFRAQVNVQDSSGRTPLVVAAAKGHTAAVALLLTHGADADVASSAGVYPIEAAAKGGRLGPVKLLAPLASSTQLTTALSRAQASVEGRSVAAFLSECIGEVKEGRSLSTTFLDATVSLVQAGLAPSTHSLAFQRKLRIQGRKERALRGDDESEQGEGEEAPRRVLGELDENFVPVEIGAKRKRTDQTQA